MAIHYSPRYIAPPPNNFEDLCPLIGLSRNNTALETRTDQQARTQYRPRHLNEAHIKSLPDMFRQARLQKPGCFCPETVTCLLNRVTALLYSPAMPQKFFRCCHACSDSAVANPPARPEQRLAAHRTTLQVRSPELQGLQGENGILPEEQGDHFHRQAKS